MTLNGAAALLSIAYLPPIDYFKVIAQSPSWEIERCDSYQKQSYRNRSYIYGANGRLPLIIPILRGEGGALPIVDVEIDNSERWQKIHWMSILSAYSSSPFFDYYSDSLSPHYRENYTHLFDFNCQLLTTLLELLDLPSQLQFTDQFKPIYYGEKAALEGGDFRELIDPKRGITLSKEKRDYYQPFSHKHGFIANLSIIDLLFNMGPEALEYLLN